MERSNTWGVTLHPTERVLEVFICPKVSEGFWHTGASLQVRNRSCWKGINTPSGRRKSNSGQLQLEELGKISPTEGLLEKERADRVVSDLL